VVIKLETHTALFGADELLREVEDGGNRVYVDGKPVSEIKFRIAYVLKSSDSSATVGLRLPHKRTSIEYETSLDGLQEGDLVNARVVEIEQGNYRIVSLLGPA